MHWFRTKWSPWLPVMQPLIQSQHGWFCDLWEGEFKDFLGSGSLSCVLGSGKPRENQTKPRQSTSDIKTLIVIGEILKDYSIMGRRDQVGNYLSNILAQITMLHADVSRSASVCTINLIKMCVYGSSGDADSKLERGELHCPDTCRSWVTWLCAVCRERAITQRLSKGTAKLKHVRQFFRCVKQQSASAALAAHGLGPWAVWIWNSQLRAHTRRWSRRNPWCPAQWGHFKTDHGSLSLVLNGGEKHFDRPMKNLFEVSFGVEKICVLFKKSYEGKQGRAHRCELQPVYRSC